MLMDELGGERASACGGSSSRRADSARSHGLLENNALSRRFNTVARAPHNASASARQGRQITPAEWRFDRRAMYNPPASAVPRRRGQFIHSPEASSVRRYRFAGAACVPACASGGIQQGDRGAGTRRRVVDHGRGQRAARPFVRRERRLDRHHGGCRRKPTGSAHVKTRLRVPPQALHIDIRTEQQSARRRAHVRAARGSLITRHACWAILGPIASIVL